MTNEIDSLLPLLLKDSKLNNRQQNLFIKVLKKIEHADAEERTSDEWFVLGYAAEAQGNELKASEYYTEAIKGNPEFEAAYKNRGSVFTRLKEYDDALFDLKKAIELDPDYLDAKLQLSVLYSEQDKFEEAMALLDEILKKESNHLRAHAQLGAIYDKQEKYPEAIEELDIVIEKNTEDGNLYSQRAISKLFNGDAAEAVKDFQKAQRYSGANYITYFNLGLSYGMMEDGSKQAYQQFEKAFRKQPAILASYFKEAKDGETGRLAKKIDEIVDHLKKTDENKPGKFYRDELIDLLERKLNEARNPSAE